MDTNLWHPAVYRSTEIPDKKLVLFPHAHPPYWTIVGTDSKGVMTTHGHFRTASEAADEELAGRLRQDK